MARRYIRAANWSGTETLVELYNDVARQLNVYEASAGANQVLSNDSAEASGTAGRTGMDMVIHGSNAENVKMDNAFFFQFNGQKYYAALNSEFDTSGSTANTDTVTASGDGAFWVFVNTAGGFDAESNQTAQNFASPVEALSQYSIPTNTLPPGTDDVCVGVIGITEAAGGGFIFGPDSISAETQIFHSFEGLPGIESEMATFALDAAAATFTYAAADVVLGSGVRVVLSGKANVTFNSSTQVARGAVGAYLLYALADDTEACVTQSSTHADLQTAKDAIRDMTPNPLLPLIGVIYVVARKQAFTPNTTLLDATGIDTTFQIVGTGTNNLEYGRSNGSQHTPIDDIQTQEGIL